jgi:hypothetical protein
MAESWGNHVAIVAEGILRQPNDSSLIIPGLMLYKSLVKDHRVSLIIDTSSEARKKIQYWLLMNSLTDHTKEIYWDDTDSEDTAERRISQIGRLRQDGPLSMVFESDTNCATALMKIGVPSFLFLHPQYMHPEHRPGNSPEITPWNELLSEQRRQREARATDTRYNDF